MSYHTWQESLAGTDVFTATSKPSTMQVVQFSFPQGDMSVILEPMHGSPFPCASGKLGNLPGKKYII